jgi:hypothetical protein
MKTGTIGRRICGSSISPVSREPERQATLYLAAIDGLQRAAHCLAAVGADIQAKDQCRYCHGRKIDIRVRQHVEEHEQEDDGRRAAPKLDDRGDRESRGALEAILQHPTRHCERDGVDEAIEGHLAGDAQALEHPGENADEAHCAAARPL